MNDGQSPPPPGPTILSLPRPIDGDHTPTVSSPLNPDASANRLKPKPAVREQREKKESLKKREAANGNTRGNTPMKKTKNEDHTDKQGLPSPIRYNHSLPKENFYYTGPRDPVLTSHEPEPLFTPDGSRELRRPTEHAENKKAFRYTHCIADPTFPHSKYFRQTDGAPYNARMSFEDSDKWFHFDDSATIIRNAQGWRMGRANVCAREGRYYYEVKILRGVPREGAPAAANPGEAQPHIRMGWARREAPLDAAPGFDGYSYGLRDIGLEPYHKSRPSKYLDNGTDKKPGKKPTGRKAAAAAAASTEFTLSEHACEGDVVGLEISLPSLAFHRKIVDGSYNPAVDVDDGLDDATFSKTHPPLLLSPQHLDATTLPADIVRDRFPVPYKGTVYFEAIEVQRSKGMDAYGDRGPFAKETPTPNHDDPALRCLPHSRIRVFKNGRLLGTAFRALMAFLPPASLPQGTGARPGLDDGVLGYYPAVAAFMGGVAQVNLGPDFWWPPEELRGGGSGGGDADGDVVMVDGAADDMNAAANAAANASTDPGPGDTTTTTPTPAAPPPPPAGRRLRPISERYTEQIAEDVLFDVIDEADFFVQDGGVVLEDPLRSGGGGAVAATAGGAAVAAAAETVVGEEQEGDEEGEREGEGRESVGG